MAGFGYVTSEGALPSTPRYKVGSVIEYQPFGGGIRRVVVTDKDSNIKNGRPGFDGRIAGDDDPIASVWGYDDQITRVVSV